MVKKQQSHLHEEHPAPHEKAGRPFSGRGALQLWIILFLLDLVHEIADNIR